MKVQSSHTPHTIPVSPPECRISYKWWTTLTHHHPQSIVYSRVHSWGCTWVWTHVQWRVRPRAVSQPWKSSVLHLFVHPSPFTPGNPRSMYCVHSLAFSRMSQSWTYTVRGHSLFGSHLVTCSQGCFVAPHGSLVLDNTYSILSVSTAVSQVIWFPASQAGRISLVGALSATGSSQNTA